MLGIVATAAVAFAVVVARPGSTTRAAASGVAAKAAPSRPAATPLPFVGANTATSGRVIVVMKKQFSYLNLEKQGKQRRALAFADQTPVVASIKASGVNQMTRLVAVNAVAAQLSKSEVSQLLKLPSVARVVPDVQLTMNAAPALSPAASVPSSQVLPPPHPASCPATGTSPTGVTNVVQEPEAMGIIHASDGIAGDPNMANTYATGAGVVVANEDINGVQGNPNFTRPNGQPVAINVPSNDTNLLSGNDEFDEDASSIAAQGTVVYQYDTGAGTGQTGATNQGALPFSGITPSCQFYIIGAAPGASLVDSSNITTPPSLASANGNVTLESQVIAGIDAVTDAALPAAQANEISESYGEGSYEPQNIFAANDAAVAAGLQVFVSSGDAGDSQQTNSTMNPLAADPNVMDLGAVDGLRLIALADGFSSYDSLVQMGAITSGGVGSAALGSGQVGDTFRVVDVVAPGWFGGESACVINSGGCPSWYPTEAARGTSESAPLSAGGGADVIQAYRNTHGGASPSPAMIKALLDGAASDIDSPSDEQGSGLLNIFQAVQAAMQMPGTTDSNSPVVNGLIPWPAPNCDPSCGSMPSQIDVAGQPGTTDNVSVNLYNTSPSSTTVTGMWRKMGPQSTIDPTVTEPVSAPPVGTSIPFVGATAAQPITFNVPAGLDRLEVSAITPDPANDTMLQIQLFGPNGAFMQESYDDGSFSSSTTSLSAATAVNATNIKVASVSGATVGDKVAVDTLSNEQIDTVAAVGKASSTTTLTAASGVNATNIKVASDTSISVGDTLSIDTGASNESATVSAVGTASTSTTLSAGTAGGATNITVASLGSIIAGDTITIDTSSNQDTAVVKSTSSVRSGGVTTNTITLTAGLTHAHNSGAAVSDSGSGVTLMGGLQFAHSIGATVSDAGSGVTLSSPLTAGHASGANVYFNGSGSEPNIQEIEVAAPPAGQWTADILWNGVDQDVGAAPPTPGLYTGNVSVDFQGSQWQYAPATGPTTIAGHSSATIPISYQFPGVPGDYPQSIQFAATNGATTSYPFVGRTMIPTGFNIPFTGLMTGSVGRSGGDEVNQYWINVPPGSASITVNASTPDASANNQVQYFLLNNTDTSSGCSAPLCTSITEPQNGVDNGTLTISNPTPGLWQLDVSMAQRISGLEFTQVVNGTVTVVPSTSVGGSVNSTLSVSIPPGTPSFGTFTPGLAQNYSVTVPATVTSTAATSTLSAADANTGFPAAFSGHLANTAASGGPYDLAQGLQVDASSSNSSATGGGVYSDLSVTNPATILSYTAPVSNDLVTVGFLQPIGANDPLRTGSYTKSITITLSTNTP